MIDVVGIGADGLAGVSAESRRAVAEADVVFGSRRQLAALPGALDEGAVQRHRVWPSPLLPALPGLLAEVAHCRVVVLASGDPLVSGIGSTLIRLLGPGAVRVHPALSSVSLARARLGWAAESCETVSLVTAPVETLLPRLAPEARLVVLSAGAQTPVAVASLLVEAGWPQARLTVLANLGADDESRFESSAEQLAPGEIVAGGSGEPASGAPEREFAALNVIGVHCGRPCRPLGFAVGTSPGLPDEAFEHDGQLTKWELRIAALARLRPVPGQLLWDLGAGAGSVALEWARHHPTCKVVAVERNPERAQRITANAMALGVPRAVDVRVGSVLDLLAELPPPDAVFVGGGASAEVLEGAWVRLRAGGRLVAHAVTLRTEAVLVAAAGRWGGDLRRLSVERAEPLGAYLSWTPARPVVQWAVVKPASLEAQDSGPAQARPDDDGGEQ